MGLVMLVGVAFLVVLAVLPISDGKSFGGAVAGRFLCAVRGDCQTRDDALVDAYGADTATLVRQHLPGLVYEPGEGQLPVDWRECRDVACATASLDRDLDVHYTDRGLRATVFTHVVRRGGRLYIQYWFYYPDSNSSWAGSDWIWRHSPGLQGIGWVLTGSPAYPGYHRDDWEGAVVSIDADGGTAMRVTSHGGWQWCKSRGCDRWGPETGWSRVSRGSHSGHVPTADGVRSQLPGHHLRERTTTADGIRLIPLERVDRSRYRRLDPDISPPWSKDTYANPESSAS